MDTPTLVGTTSEVAPSELHTYHRNPRRGDVNVIMGSLAAHGQYRPVVVNIGTHTGRPNEVLAGNHTLMAVRRLAEQHPDDPRWSAVKVHWGDWDEDTCAAIVLADNRTAELGGMDLSDLYDLLTTLPDLEGTGYSALDLESLEQSLNPPSLDDLADEHGEGLTDEDLLERVGLKLSPDVAARWHTHRDNFASDDDALDHLL